MISSQHESTKQQNNGRGQHAACTIDTMHSTRKRIAFGEKRDRDLLMKFVQVCFGSLRHVMFSAGRFTS